MPGARSSLALYVTALCLLIGYPAAFGLAKHVRGRWREALFLLIILPFWSNALVRTFSWTMVLREPVDLLFTYPAIVIGLVHAYLPYAILTCYISLASRRRHPDRSRPQPRRLDPAGLSAHHPAPERCRESSPPSSSSSCRPSGPSWSRASWAARMPSCSDRSSRTSSSPRSTGRSARPLLHHAGHRAPDLGRGLARAPPAASIGGMRAMAGVRIANVVARTYLALVLGLPLSADRGDDRHGLQPLGALRASLRLSISSGSRPSPATNACCAPASTASPFAAANAVDRDGSRHARRPRPSRATPSAASASCSYCFSRRSPFPGSSSAPRC